VHALLLRAEQAEQFNALSAGAIDEVVDRHLVCAGERQK